ncbi:MAG: class I SAM-dependent RNA methyltransferase [Rhodobacteraceae bacterium]|nr:class I SAM-dependent RNA methyltransferase [Paracoccaceae bacterium]
MQEYTINRLGLKGDGIAEDGTFIPFSLPGERFSGAMHKGHLENPVRLSDVAERVTPACPHFGICGGCTLQHASDNFLSQWKVETVRRALEAQGLTTAFRPIDTSPPHSRRRATFSGRRTKKTTQVGFHKRGSAEIFDLKTCDLLRPEIIAALPACHALAGLGASRKGEIKISVSQGMAGADIDVREARALDGPLRARLAALAGEHALARLTWNGEQVADRKRPVQQMGKAQVLPPAGAFLQATAAGEAALVEAMLEAVSGAKRVVDLFAGCGTFSLPLAAGAEVHAVEGEAEMLAALDKGWRFAQGLKTVTTETRDLFSRPLVPLDLRRFDAVVIDPPRAGAKAQMEEIVTSDIRLVGAVSCNPVSFARDARILVDGGFTLDWVKPVDQFRWSGHIELAARFSR